MKRFTALFSALLLVFLLCSCSQPGNVSKTVVDYGDSEIYSRSDIDSAVKVIKKTFKEMQGCTLYSLSYAGDDVCNTDEMVDYCNDLAETTSFTQCMVLDSLFKSPLNGGGVWQSNEKYTWTWYLAREDGGQWELLTYGYC